MNIQSQTSDVIVRVLKKNQRKRVDTLSDIERIVRLVHQTINSESAITFSQPENLLEIQIRQEVTFGPLSLAIRLEPHEALIGSQLLVQSFEWLNGRRFAINLPENPNLTKGLLITLSKGQPDIYTTVIYREPEAVRNGIAEVHIVSNRGCVPRTEVVECNFRGAIKTHVYHLREPIPGSRSSQNESNFGFNGSPGSNRRDPPPIPEDFIDVAGPSGQHSSEIIGNLAESPRTAAIRRSNEGGPGNPLEELRTITSSFTRAPPVYPNVNRPTSPQPITPQKPPRRVPTRSGRKKSSNILVETNTISTTTTGESARNHPVTFHGPLSGSTGAYDVYQPDFSDDGFNQF